VPEGSVGIAGIQTGIYPIKTPGGWRLIGRTFVRLYNPDKNPPTLLKPGDYVKFQEVKKA
jgi:KipI family sensor histidine kinase inhibitor